MAYAVCLRLDDVSAAAVSELWRALVDNGGSSEMLQLGYPPHLSLAVLDGDPDRAAVEAAFKSLHDTVVLPATLGGPRCFDGTSIVWLAVDGGKALKRLHGRLMAHLPVSMVHEHYRDGQWTPHVTLQLNGDVDQALELANRVWGDPRPSRFVGLDLVQFPPIRVVDSLSLAVMVTSRFGREVDT